MTRSSKPLARYFHTPLTPDRIERNWGVIAGALPVPRKRSQVFFPVFAAASFALVLLVLFRPFGPFASKGAIDGAVLVTGVDEEETMELADGSNIQLAEATRLRLVRVSGRDVRLELEQGDVDLHVAHVDGRKFIVAAGGVEVGVVGTRFHVGVDPAVGQVRVSVMEGRVQLTRKDSGEAPRFLSAGETWSTSSPSTNNVAMAVTSSPNLPVPATKPRAASTGSADGVSKARLSRKFHELFREGHYADAYTEAGEDKIGALVTTLGPQDLFALAEDARLSGHPKEAALAFDGLRSSYPKDSRAGLAALELGRLRLSELDDPAGAREAFDEALQLQPDGPFREDAEARRIQAIEALGDREGCVEARDRYLAAYPNGLHAVSIARRCH